MSVAKHSQCVTSIRNPANAPLWHKALPYSLVLIALIAALSKAPLSLAQATAQPPQKTDGDRARPNLPYRPGLEILSDTRGVDFGPYIKGILTSIKKSWLTYIPQEGRPPTNMQAETIISFTIDADGKLAEMRLDGSDHKDSFNRAAWGAITSIGKFPPLPSEFTGPNLQLRIQFLVNKVAAEKPLQP